MHLIDRTVPLPPPWPPPRSATEYESLVRYLRHRDPVGFVVHLALACLALFLAPLWQAPSAIAFGGLAGYALLRLPNTWRTYSALLADPALLAWAGFGSLLTVSIVWNPFGPGRGLDHLGAWRVMLYPVLLLPVLAARRLLLAALLLGCIAQLALMIGGSHGLPGHRWIGTLHNVNLTGMWGAALATTGTAALFWGHWWGLIVMGGGVTTSLFSASRGGLVAIAIGAAVVLAFGILAGRGRRDRWWRPCRVLLPLAAAGFVAMAVLPTSAQRIERSLLAAGTASGTTESVVSAVLAVDPTRFHLWRLAGMKAQERPILGWGFGAYPSITTGTIDTFDRQWWVQPERANSLSTIGHFQGSHSMYMRVACEQGLVGMAALLVAVVLTIEALARMTRRSAMALGGLGVVVVWLVYAGTEDAHTMTRALLPLPLVLALVILGDHFDARRPS